MGGIAVFAVGAMCLPIGYGHHHPKRDLSVFFNIAEMGDFIKAGLLLIGVGLIAVILSFLLPGEMDDDDDYWR
jgi:hypothetical protein